MSFNFKKSFFQPFWSALFATSLTFILIAFASLIKLTFSLSDDFVEPTAKVIKVLSLIIAGLIFIKNGNGLIKGIIFGVLSAVLISLLFTLVSSVNQFSNTFYLELLIYSLLGSVIGIVSVNVKK